MAIKRSTPPELADESGICTSLTIYVNGEKHTVTDAQPEMTLLEWLRSLGE